MLDIQPHHWQSVMLEQQIQGKLFHPATGLIYDYITSHDDALRFQYLPSPQEIAQSFPNPCGWSTGMEDCAINTGLMLCHLTDTGRENTEFATALAKGLLNCERIHGVRGFIVRGILPADGNSCYINSSRDQVTVAVYSMWKYIQGKQIPPELQQQGRTFLLNVADYCAQTILPDNQYNYRRLDGGPAIVSDLWACDPHEMLRLPMIYGIALQLSEDKRYAKLLNQVLEEGLRQTLTMDVQSPDWWDMPLLQMQLSLSFFQKSNLVPHVLPQIRQAMRQAADIALSKIAELILEAESYAGNWTVLFPNWRLLPMFLRRDSLSHDGRSALHGGLAYMNPTFNPSFARPNYLIRGLGNYLATMALCPDFPIGKELLTRINRLFTRLDVANLAGVGTVPLLVGFSKAQTYAN